MRHGHRQMDPPRGASVSTLAREYPRGSHVALHAHRSDQLIYARTGVMQVSSGQNLWFIPPQFGLWIPARMRHQIHMPERVSMRTVYLRPGLTDLPPSSKVLHVRPLLREIIFEIVDLGYLRTTSHLDRALGELLVSELERASAVPTVVVLPADRRARAVAGMVIDDLGAHSSLASACAAAGLSVRTLERIFRKEVGTDFETWRRQVRLMKAIELLVSGSSVKEAAFAVGYQQSNPLVGLFRRTFATTPKAWISALARSHSVESSQAQGPSRGARAAGKFGTEGRDPLIRR